MEVIVVVVVGRGRRRRRRLVCGVGRSDDGRVSLAVMTWFDAPRSHWLLLWFVLGCGCCLGTFSPAASVASFGSRRIDAVTRIERKKTSNEVMSPSTRKGKGFIGVVVVVVSFRSRIVVVIRDPSLLSSLRRRWLRRRRL